MKMPFSSFRFACSLLLLAGGWLFVPAVQAQFAPPVGEPGSDAISKDDFRIKNWAVGCEVNRGPMQIDQPELGNASVGESSFALGKSDGQVVSLGDGGSATLYFKNPIKNGEGFDFAVFENAFIPDFLELAFVEVSSDGKHFVRFPAISNTDTSQQKGAFDRIDARQIHNLAGKYILDWGTPFDLDELKNTPGLDVDNIVAVRIVDVVGNLNPTFSTHDSRGIPVNDPWPTPFPSGGFDLDAVVVLHEKSPAQWKLAFDNQHRTLMIEAPISNAQIKIFNQQGKVMMQHNLNANLEQIPMSGFVPGMYIMQSEEAGKRTSLKFLIN